MNLDVILPTYNRETLLSKALESLFLAEVPPEHVVRVTVVDNNSTDDTKEVVELWKPSFEGRLQYLFEPTAGKSSALNCGIRATSGELVGMVDDDEEIDRNWYNIAFETMREAAIDFVGGPYVPRFVSEIPAWLPRGYGSVIGRVDGGPVARNYGEDYDGMLMGGNAIIRRRAFDRVGLYNIAVGKMPGMLLSGEDEDMYDRLRQAGMTGRYIPELVIYHHVFPARLTKRYYRQWCLANGISRGYLDRLSPTPDPHLAGIPRWVIGRGIRSAIRLAKATIILNQSQSEVFENELELWILAGFIHGRHIFRPAASRSGQALSR